MPENPLNPQVPPPYEGVKPWVRDLVTDKSVAKPAPVVVPPLPLKEEVKPVVPPVVPPVVDKPIVPAPVDVKPAVDAPAPAPAAVVTPTPPPVVK